MANQKVTYFPALGGEDLLSSDLVVKPGRLRFSKNYEPRSVSGYRRIDGYERYDGQPKPSLANQAFFNIDAVTNTVSVGDKLTGGTSGAVAYVVGQTAGVGTAYDFPDTDDLFVDNDVLTNVTAGNTYATVDLSTTPIYGPYTTNSSSLTGFIGASQTVRRDLITAVPGSGVIRGIHRLNGDLYAFRDNAGATATDLYKATATGWVQQTLGYEIAFTTGATAKLQRGETITCSAGTGAKTGIVTAVNISSGTIGGGNAAGTLYFHTLDGTMAAGTITGSTSGGTVAIGGAPSAITLNAGGKHDIIKYNFFGQSDSLAMYGASGVDDAYMWNGSGLAKMPEAAGSSGLYPTHISVQKNHLTLSFLSSVIISETGDPFGYLASGGAAEIAVGDDITGFDPLPGDVLAIFSRNSTNILAGSASTGSDLFNLKNHSRNSGAREWTIQRVGVSRYLDDRGLTQLNAVDAFGDFKENAFSKYINSYVKSKMGQELDSVVVREKDQYRIFYSDGTGLIARIPEEGGFPAFTRIKYPINVNTCITTEDNDGVEELFFGSTDGFVYQMDSGNSFDGAALDYSLRFPYYSVKTPRNIKRFFKVVLEIEPEIGEDSTVSLNFAPDFSYGSPLRPKGKSQTFDVSGGGAFWDEGAVWSEFYWGQFPNEAEGYIKGSGRNIAMLISGSSILEGSHTITGITLQYAMRGVKK